MFPYCRVPTHITALYVFTVINFLALFHVTIVHAEVTVLTRESNIAKKIINDAPAQFGPRIDLNGLEGLFVIAEPLNACSPIENAPDERPWIVLIRQSNGTAADNCPFVDKVRNAMLANYQAAIVYNWQSDAIIQMGARKDPGDLIPSVFIGLSDALSLQANYSNFNKYKLRITEPYENFNIMDYLIAFACIMGFIFVVVVTSLLVRCVRDYQQRRRRQLSPQLLKKLPVKKFEKGSDQYETCAICLEDYLEGDKLRILPCAHAYHMKCIDPWLTKNKRTCPVCKRKVFSEGEGPDSDDDSDDDERTPLVPQHGSRAAAAAVGGNTFGAVGNTQQSLYSRYFDDDLSSSSDSDANRSSVEASGEASSLPNLPVFAGSSINSDEKDVVFTVPV